jgi:hypothetical protein
MAKIRRSPARTRPAGSKVAPGDPFVPISTANVLRSDVIRLTRLQGRLAAETGRRITQWHAIHAALSVALDEDARLVAGRLPAEPMSP